MKRSGQSGAGVALALSVVIGAVVGIMRGEPSLGFLGGLAVGLVLAIGFSIRNR